MFQCSASDLHLQDVVRFSPLGIVKTVPPKFPSFRDVRDGRGKEGGSMGVLCTTHESV